MYQPSVRLVTACLVESVSVLLSVSGLSKQFGVDIVLDAVSFRLDPREKVALVGRNGTGKTTLIKILTGEMQQDKGTVQLSRGAKVGYLRQEAPVGEGRTVLQEVESALEIRLRLKKRLQELEARLEQGPTDDDLDEYALVHEHFIEAEGYSAESDIKTVLLRMGFEEQEFDRPTAALSGGERTRLAIARLLLEEPDLLVLDEPTNHLDLQATEWLEGWITKYHGAVLLVSHDREFLRNTAQRTIELRDHKAESFPGGFDQYLKLRKERDEHLADLAKKQQDQIAKLDEYVRRFMNSQRTAQARGRLKQMQKLESKKVSAPKDQRAMKGAIKASKRSGEIVFECQGLSIGYGETPLLQGLDWTVRWGERWGVIGENGAGKSTLVRTLLGMQPPLLGLVRAGKSVEVGYFAQEAQGLDQDLSPLQFLCYECGMDSGPARDLLGRFLIEGDDVFRPIGTLSGGEKNKLAVARLCQLSPNALVLDEPTNHLDMASREALAELLHDYKGTLVLVSHDRWLLGQLTESILDLRRSGPVVYPGSYDEYKRRGSMSLAVRKTIARVQAPQRPASQRETSKEIERLRRTIAENEQTVTELERSVAVTESQLASPEAGADLVALAALHSGLRTKLEAALTEWESSARRLELLTTGR